MGRRPAVRKWKIKTSWQTYKSKIHAVTVIAAVRLLNTTTKWGRLHFAALISSRREYDMYSACIWPFVYFYMRSQPASQLPGSDGNGKYKNFFGICQLILLLLTANGSRGRVYETFKHLYDIFVNELIQLIFELSRVFIHGVLFYNEFSKIDWIYLLVIYQFCL